MNRYTLGVSIGQGAFGRVAQATDALGAQVAVKIVDIVSDRTREHVISEARIHARLSHPNLVKFIESFEVNGSYHIVMEYVNGSDLGQMLKPMEEFEILKIFTQVLEGVAYMHDRGIVHRDLKAGNILVDKEGTVKIADFGMSVELPPCGFVRSEVPVGTPGYMAPEVVNGERTDAKSDVFSLGCILLEMATLKKPCETRDVRAMFPKQYTPALANMINAMLSTDPSKRPTVREILKLPIIKCAMRKNEVVIDMIPRCEESKQNENGDGEGCDRLLEKLDCLKKDAGKSSDWLVKLSREVEMVIGTKTFKTLRYHLMNEFDDMDSADFVREYEETKGAQVKLIRELMTLEQ